MTQCKHWQASFTIHNHTPVVKEPAQMICLHPGQLSGKCEQKEETCPLLHSLLNVGRVTGREDALDVS